uniref:Uncharacterized protein n=1 Tax=Onchocerca volvulus TaxID=6282 RepID=A0A8R1TQJ6_ONCVO
MRPVNSSIITPCRPSLYNFYQQLLAYAHVMLDLRYKGTPSSSPRLINPRKNAHAEHHLFVTTSSIQKYTMEEETVNNGVPQSYIAYGSD